MVDKMLGFLSENWREYFLKYFNAHPEVIRNEFEKLLLALPVSPEQKAFARQFCDVVSQRPFAVHGAKRELHLSL
jgi:hypothetical protein